jgi:hypothetical protein
MENMPLQTFISSKIKNGEIVHFVLPGAIISGECNDLLSFTFVLELKNCTVYTGSSKVSIDILYVSADKDILSWGSGEIKNLDIK